MAAQLPANDELLAAFNFFANAPDRAMPHHPRPDRRGDDQHEVIGGAAREPHFLDYDMADDFPLIDLGDYADEQDEAFHPHQQDHIPPVLDPERQDERELVVIDDDDFYAPPEVVHEESSIAANAQPSTGVRDAQTCLEQILVIFPEVEHDYVLRLYNGFDVDTDYEALPPDARLQNILDRLADENYPRRARPTKKRKTDETAEHPDAKRWEGPQRGPADPRLKAVLVTMIKADFPAITQKDITTHLDTHKHFYPTYIAIANAFDSNPGGQWRGRAMTRTNADARQIAEGMGEDLVEELDASRKQVDKIRQQRRQDEANLEQAKRAGAIAECQACFDDLPMNRQAHCNGPEAHFTCLECLTKYIKSEVGDARAKVFCTSGCGAGFSRAQLDLVPDKQLLEKLEQLQQEQDIRDADIEGLEECPFCDFKVGD